MFHGIFLETSVFLLWLFLLVGARDEIELEIRPEIVPQCRPAILRCVHNVENPRAYHFRNLWTGKTVTQLPPFSMLLIESAEEEHKGDWMCIVEKRSGRKIQSRPTRLHLREDADTDMKVGCDNRQYIFHRCPKTFSDAETYCSRKGMRLASPGDSLELSELQTGIEASDKNIVGIPYWIGISRRGYRYPWKAAGCRAEKVFTSLPKKARGKRHCVGVHGGHMQVYGCRDKRPFVCVKAPCDELLATVFRGRRYSVFGRKRNRDGAERFCRDNGMKLYSLDSMPEWEHVTRALISANLEFTELWSDPEKVGRRYYSNSCGRRVDNDVRRKLWREVRVNKSRTCTVTVEYRYQTANCDACKSFICEDPDSSCRMRPMS